MKFKSRVSLDAIREGGSNRGPLDNRTILQWLDSP
jgi:hypothetical protein